MASTADAKKTTPNAKKTTPDAKKAVRPPNEYFNDLKTVRVYVGPKRKLWTLPEDLLCDQVEFFRKAFKNGVKDGQEKEIYLEGETPEAFAKFVDWLFRGGLSWVRSEITSSDLVDWCALYALAEKWSFYELMAYASVESKMFIEKHGLLSVSRSAISYIYTHDSKLSALRKIVVEEATKYYLTSSSHEMGDWIATTRHVSGFDMDVAKSIKSHLKNGSRGCSWDTCDAHGDGKKKNT